MRFEATDIFFLSSILALLIERIFYYKSKYSNRKNPVNDSKPGKATTCIEHGKKLTELNTKVEDLEDDLEKYRKENREDHNRIFDKINRARKK